MSNPLGESDIVATSKFKPSKPLAVTRQRQQENDIVDDWDADSSDEGDSIGSNDKKPIQETKDVFRASKDQWTEA